MHDFRPNCNIVKNVIFYKSWMRTEVKDRMSEVEGSTSSQSIVWEMLEEVAVEKFYVNDSNRPGILIVPKHWFGMRGYGYAVVLNYVGVICTTTSKKKALERVRLLAERDGILPFKLYRETEKGRVLFAENREVRLDPTKRYVEDAPIAIFKVPEWEET